MLIEKIDAYMMSHAERFYKINKDINFSLQHRNILDAIILNEPALAEKEMKDHIDDAFIDVIFYSLFSKYYKDNPQSDNEFTKEDIYAEVI
jgi:DNA-binding GntR family transcriptional regulator